MKNDTKSILHTDQLQMHEYKKISMIVINYKLEIIKQNRKTTQKKIHIDKIPFTYTRVSVY
jgi:hypothetical protein